MNKHSRIIVILLLIVLIAICTAIVIFHIDVGKDAQITKDNYSVSETTAKQSSANVFKDNNGLWGLKDSGGIIILEPEWTELIPIGIDSFKAKLITRSGSLYGIIDQKGDITVPFVYSNIEQLNEYLYVADMKDTDEYLFYNSQFDLLLPYSADNYFINNGSLCIVKGKDKFTYKLGENLVLVKSELSRFMRPIDINISIEDPEVLAAMNSLQWSSLGDKIVLFLDTFRRNKKTLLSEITDPDAINDITTLVETEHSWKGKLSENTYVYMSDDIEKNKLYLKTELLVIDEDKTDLQNIQMTIGFIKNESGEWLVCEASLE